MSQATAAGARMCQGTFFFTRVARSYQRIRKKLPVADSVGLLQQIEKNKGCDNDGKD